MPCVLFSGSVIGVKRHHGLVPIGEKDIDIACWSDDWQRDHILLEKTLNKVFGSWSVSLQGYYVSIDNSGKGKQQYFVDIWLHGPSDLTKKGTIDDPTRCVGFNRATFESFPMYRILPELAYYMVKTPSRTKSKKYEWKNVGDYPSCFLFYKFFGKQYLNKWFRSAEISRGESPIWPRKMFFQSSTSDQTSFSQRTGLFGTKLVPIPIDMDGYIKQRYGPVTIECGQKITSNAAPCSGRKWSSSGMVRAEKNKEILVSGLQTLHTIYKCSDGYSCSECGVNVSMPELVAVR
jgi:hypothetical protein